LGAGFQFLGDFSPSTQGVAITFKDVFLRSGSTTRQQFSAPSASARPSLTGRSRNECSPCRSVRLNSLWKTR
jgi:hypothetical protein